jgi:hypothetical protein
MEIICPHNPQVVCPEQNCDKCGWNPKVADSRLKKIKESLGMTEKLYKIPFTGYCEVWANSPEEASIMAEDLSQQYFAQYEYGDPVCLTKEEENELD